MLDPAVDSYEDVPLWDVSWPDFDEQEASFAIRCNGKLFFIEVSAKDLGGWSSKQEFLQLLQDAPDDFDAEQSIYDLVSDACNAILRTHALGAEAGEPFTLQKYYAPEPLCFKLVGHGNGIKAVQCANDPQKTAKLAPQFALSEISDSSKVPHLDASTIIILPSTPTGEDSTIIDPRTVSVDGDSSRYHFKAV